MSLISQILPLENIILDFPAKNKTQIFEYIGLQLAQKTSINASDISECLNAREQLGSTALGQGVAIPHGRSACLKQATGFFIRLAEPLDFDAPDDKPVQLVFVLLVPENATSEHLEVLSALADKFSSADTRSTLLNTHSPQTIHDLLTL